MHCVFLMHTKGHSNFHAFLFQFLLDDLFSEPPRLTEGPTDESVLKPNTLHLKCKADGYPTPQIVWYKIHESGRRRELVQLSERIQQYPNGSLFIFSTSERDNGKYTCSAENSVMKNAEKTVAVNIKGWFHRSFDVELIGFHSNN